MDEIRGAISACRGMRKRSFVMGHLLRCWDWNLKNRWRANLESQALGTQRRGAIRAFSRLEVLS
jgi:hypothetical protein